MTFETFQAVVIVTSSAMGFYFVVAVIRLFTKGK